MSQSAFGRLLFFASSLVVAVSSQASFSTLGTGLLDESLLSRPGGLVFADADGDGPKANSLAAAIYGVAIPARFYQFTDSEHYFSHANNPYDSGFNGFRAEGPQPSDLLVSSGTHFNGDGGHRDGRAEISSYITDFSAFASDYGAPSPSNDLSTSPSTQQRSGSVQIDPIAARFGVVLPADEDYQGSTAGLFDPSISGPSESTSSTGTNSFYGNSPIQMTIQFQLPTQATLPDLPLTGPLRNEGELSRSDGPPPSSPASATESSVEPVTDNLIKVITSAFKLSTDEDGGGTVGGHDDGHFQQASGKFTASVSTVDDSPNLSSAGSVITTSPSPYVYRGNREREHLSQQTYPTSTEVAELPTPERLTSAGNKDKRNRARSSYSFFMAPGYRTRK